VSEHDPSTRNDLDRRQLLKAGAAGLGAAMLGVGSTTSARAMAPHTHRQVGQAPAELFAAPPMDVVRVGFVGVGLQGSAHCRNLLRIEGVELKAVCDIVPERVTTIQDRAVEAGKPRPSGYDRGEWDFVRMCEEEELDLVYTATPWEWHVPVCVTAMQSGKHAATEVPAAYTIEDCWRLVESAEEHQKHCVMMENVNYGEWESMVLNMVRQGAFGELLHGEGGYLHDLREIKFSSDNEGLWRRNHAWTRNGNLYPTHGLGPIAQCMDINRGDRFDYMVSMSGPSRGLQAFAREHFAEGAPQRYERFALGDVNVSLIKTAKGRTIYVSHDTNLPRPYSRIHLVQGTKGLFQGYPNRVYIEGRSPSHRWEEAQEYMAEFEHPLWKDIKERAQGAGHGGMDFLEDYRLIKCLREGLPTDMNVYDAAAISAVCGLSEQSVASASAPAPFPDFTRGRWETYPQLDIVRA
jgi:predicted dehydrogenase